MANKDFDDLEKILKLSFAGPDSGSGIQSVEGDFELPRGFIAKIKKVRWHAEPDESVTGAIVQGVSAVLLRDPDDTTTVTVPANVTQHDVVSEMDYNYNAEALGGRIQSGHTIWDNKQSEGLDVITARNMRMNAVVLDVQPDMNIVCWIHYTLEKVTDADILNLLDIL